MSNDIVRIAGEDFRAGTVSEALAAKCDQIRAALEAAGSGVGEIDLNEITDVLLELRKSGTEVMLLLCRQAERKASWGYARFSVNSEGKMSSRYLDAYRPPDLGRDAEREALVRFHVEASRALAVAKQDFKVARVAEGAGTMRSNYSRVLSREEGRVRLATLEQWLSNWAQNKMPAIDFAVQFSA